MKYKNLFIYFTSIFVVFLLFTNSAVADETPQEIVDRLIGENQTDNTTTEAPVDPERVSAIEALGYEYVAETDSWEIPIDYQNTQGESSGLLVHTNGDPDITAQEIVDMSDNEFTVFEAEVNLTQDGFYIDQSASDEAGVTVWSDRNSSDEVFGDTAPNMVTIDPATGNRVLYENPITEENDQGDNTGWGTEGENEPFPESDLPEADTEYSEGIVPCGWTGAGTDNTECTVCHLVELGQKLLEFLILATVLVAALLFVNAGALYIFSPTNPANIAKAHKLFMTALTGMIVVLAAWIIIGLFMEYLFIGSQLAGELGITETDGWGSILCKKL